MNQILVVEDDAAFNRAVCLSLSDLASVRTATSVDEALAVLNSEPIHLVVTDYRLAAGSNALELATHVKRFTPPPSVILMTAYAETKMAIDSVNRGVFAFLEKPFETDVLRHHVQRALGAKVTPAAFLLNPSENRVVFEGQSYALTKTEYEIIAMFVSHPNQWITRDSIEARIWNSERTGSRNIFDTHLTNMKRKLPFLKDRLETVRGRGYIFRDR